MSLVGAGPIPIPSAQRLRLRWTAAMVVGELIGFIAPAVVGVSLVELGVHELWLVVGLSMAGVLEGMVLGAAQARVLSDRWPPIGQRRWIAATATATGFAWLVGLGGSTLAGSESFPLSVALALLVPGSMVALLSMGYLQWRVLRIAVPDSARWIPVTAGAWMIGVSIPIVALSAVPGGWSGPAHLAVGVFAAVAMAVVVGAITGGTLERFDERSPADDGIGNPAPRIEAPGRYVLALRFGWTVVTWFVVESTIFGLSALPATLFYRWHLDLDFGPRPLKFFLLGAAFIPTYVLFSTLFMLLSAEATRLLRWRPPSGGDYRISELPIELRNWARYAIISHLVHVVAGVAFRSTPIWVWYMRRNGARIGRHVWVNSLQVGDDCLLDFGDEVVIGAGVHLSGHTVERGFLRLAPIRLGKGTVVGVGAHVSIGVTTGEGTQIGSMSVVPKHADLDSHGVYAGIPVRLIGQRSQ